MAESRSESRYLALDLDTGLMDGWYGDMRDGLAAVSVRRERGAGRWVLLELIDGGRHTAITHYPGHETSDAVSR
jgi:hypothetical protein